MSTETVELVIANKKYFATYAERADAEKVKSNKEKANPDNKYIIEEFGVSILKYDPEKNKATKWEKKEGFSIWQVVK